MKYWLLTTEYPPIYGGGISTYCYHTACMLSEKGHDVTVFISDRKVTDLKVEKLPEARLVRFNPFVSKANNFLGHETNISYEFALVVKKFVEAEGKPDIIESQDYNGIAYFLLQFKHCKYQWCEDIPILLTLHSPSFIYMKYNEFQVYKRPHFWIGEMEKFCIQSADMLISPSQYLVNELKQWFNIHNSNMHVLVNPFRFNMPPTNDFKKAVSNNELTFYGKLSPQKGTFKILEQFQHLWEKGLDYKFTMIGGQNIVYPPMNKMMGSIVKKKFKKYIDQKKLKLKEGIPPENRQEELAKAMLFILPSIVDNLPYVALELMSLGKILIVSKQGGQAEIVEDGKDGYVYDYSIPGDFERVLNKVIHTTADERIKLAEQAIQKINEQYAYEKVYASKMRLIRNIKSQHLTIFPFINLLPQKTALPEKKQISNQLLSVVIPYYNMGKYIEAAVDSVLKSTYAPIQLIIVNDGTTDLESIEKLNKYKGKKDIKVIDKQNTGLADTRNMGAELAEGTFLAFLDADDCVAPSYYEKAIKVLRQYENVHFIGAWTHYFDGSKNCWPTFNPEPPLILTQNSINSSALVYKKSSFLTAGKNDRTFKIGLEDYDSVLSMLSNGLNGVAIPEFLFHYRVRKNSMVRNVNRGVRDAYYLKIKEKHKVLFESFKSEVDELIKNNGKPLSEDNATLDQLPFQNVPILKTISKKLLPVLKSNNSLKKIALLYKKNKNGNLLSNSSFSMFFLRKLRGKRSN